MAGRRYYLTTLAAFERHAARFVEAHFVVVDARAGETPPVGTSSRTASAGPDFLSAADAAPGRTRILLLVDADEGAHLALESDADFEPLPHPLGRRPVSERVSTALAAFGVAPGDDTFTVSEKLSLLHPLLRHRVF